MAARCSAGLENYTCVDYTVNSYATNTQGPAAAFHSADSLFLVISQTEKLYAQVCGARGARDRAALCCRSDGTVMWGCSDTLCRCLQLGFDVRIFILHTYKVPFNGSTLPVNITAADTTDMLSHVQVSLLHDWHLTVLFQSRSCTRMCVTSGNLFKRS